MKRIMLITIFGILLLAGYGFAEIETPQVFGRDLGVEIGVEASYITYREPGIMKEKGFMYGVTGALAYRNYNYMLSLEARASLGQVDYTSKGPSGSLDNI